MEFFHLITPNTLVLTPNAGISATVLKQYSEWQIYQKKYCWTTLHCIPLYPSFIQTLWKQYATRKIAWHPRVLTPDQESIVWEKIVRESPHSKDLLAIHHTAKEAQLAWEYITCWKIQLNPIDFAATKETQLFLIWAAQFQHYCETNHWLDQHSLADIVSLKIQTKEIIPPKHILLLGFEEIRPQHQYLLETCQQHGSHIEPIEYSPCHPTSQTITLADSKTEIETMARFAKEKLSQQDTITIGCVIPNIAPHDEDIVAIFSDVFYHQKNSFSILYAKKLSLYPIIQQALQLLSSANPNIVLQNHMPSPLPMSQWVKILIKLLELLKWPSETSSAYEHPILQKGWLALLQKCASLDFILTSLHWKEALYYLTFIAENTLFQADCDDKKVKILEISDAISLSFDYLWVAGLDDTQWPGRAMPNMFIPRHLQEKYRIPHSSADIELQKAKTLTLALQRCAPHVIFSHAEKNDDSNLLPSALIKNFQKITLSQLALSPWMKTSQHIYESRKIDVIQDDVAPPISTQTITGGAILFKYQATCPFKAFAEIRLHAARSEQPTFGLSSKDRGKLIHDTLELIWKDLKTSKNLHEKMEAELHTLIHDDAMLAIKKITQHHPDLNHRYLSIELKRLKKIIWKWMEVEKTRPPFTVIAHEEERHITIGNITIKLRMDRIDALSEGLRLIIDYKTGRNHSINHWFSDRLEDPQLPLYCITDPENAHGITYAQLHPEEITFKGISQVSLEIDAIKTLDEIKNPDAPHWENQLQRWKTHLENLAKDFAQGKSTVDPKHPEICHHCQLHLLCRINQYDHHSLSNC